MHLNENYIWPCCFCMITKGWLAMCDCKLRVAMWSRKLQCAGANQFWLKLAMCGCAVFFTCAKCDRNFTHFYVYYVSVHWKLEILGFLHWAFSIWLSFNTKIRQCLKVSPKMNKRFWKKTHPKDQNLFLFFYLIIKLRLRLRVVTIKKACCERLRMWRTFELWSCECGKLK